MKLSLSVLIVALGFISISYGLPSPQGESTTPTCGGDPDQACPTGYHCCLTFTVETPLRGSCEPGRFGVCPL
ncbi:hypothetical protein BJ912DRAFT_972420 [Pholiota molesta]|nr:hypothetical protein BJ912DRAFT_972420 [Pholiota molesta]